ncbi:ABC transporter ATP-binding protein, partial [Candidatus Geothermarchaeota archaeon]
MHGIYKKFPGVVAVDNVDFNLIRGEIHSLLGENGAGKSTLMKILYGYYRPDRGRIFVDGREVRFRSPSDAIKYGIGMVFQHFNLVDSLTVLENIILGDDNLGFIPDYSSARKRVIEIINEYGFKLDPDTGVGYLSVGEKQRVEIIKLLYQNSRVMIFDEPTTVLTPAEKSTLFNFFYNVSNEDRSIIFITHKLEEAMNVSDRITVMKRGKVVATLKPEETDINELARLMVGRIEPYEIRRSSRRGKTILKI